MKKRVVSLLVATIMTVMAGAFAPAVTASITISDSNTAVFTNKLDKSGTGTITGVAGTEKTVNNVEIYSDYTVNMTAASGYAQVKDTSIQTIKESDYGWAYFRFSISDANNFVLKFDLNYGKSSGNATKTIFNAKDYVSIAGNLQNPKDYTVHLIFDFVNDKAYFDFNKLSKDELVEVSVSDFAYLRQLRFANNQGIAHGYKASGMLLEAFPLEATYDDVLTYLTGGSSEIDYQNGTYFEGINAVSTSETVSYGSMYITDGSCSISGKNTDGYTLTDTANGGSYKYLLFNNSTGSGAGMTQQTEDSIVRHSVLIRPKSGDKTVSIGKYSTQEELLLLYFDEDNAKICDKNGKTVLANYDSNKFYQVDVFFNNKNYEYSVYFDGKEALSGMLSNTPVGYISYKNGASGDSMVLKTIFTKVYALGTSLNTVTGDIYGEMYVEMQDLTVFETEDGDYEISAAAVFSEVSKNYKNPKIIYTLYQNGVLLNVAGTDIKEELSIKNDEMNLDYSKIDRKYPYGLLKTIGATISEGDILSVKARFIADDEEPVESNEISFTVE